MKGFFTIESPMTQSILLNFPFKCSEYREIIFQNVKDLLTTAHILTCLVEDEVFKVYYDAYDIVLGCVLMQLGGVIA